ncbi:E3 ubiquitin-protein ligase TRIM71-like [Mercenaria mercenaria]|uniref:E3 ubiquitin-protein ligase TRIM71-like n=1 Tax=Mercenaria mercenaria TaxID=6596 RepID=UPI00234E497A|nr:E3 ubiquitin-protein ligase TRIM71-like [Mercenaria mercenaria]
MSDDQYYASEDSVVMNCDPCQFEGIQKDARAFCQECNEYLCKQCLKSHRKFQVFRHHFILQGDSMPRTREETKPKLALKLCDDHRMNEVQFYCSTHKSVLCTLCKMTRHSTCDCELIDDICEKDDQAKFHNVAKEIEVIKTEFEELKSVQIEAIDSTTANSKSQRSQLDSIRKEMNDYFDKLENEIKEGEIQEKSYVKELRENVAMYTDVINNLASLKEHADHVSNSNDKLAIFAAKSKLEKIHLEYTTVKNTITLKPKTRKSWEVMQKLLTVKEICDNIKKKMNVQTSEEKNAEEIENKDAGISMNEMEANHKQYSDNSKEATSTNDKVKESNANKPAGNDVSIQQDLPEEKPSHLIKANARKKAESQKQDMLFENLRIKNIIYKNINFEMNDSTSDVTGSLFLPGGSLILCDHANSKLILLDKEFQLLHQLYFKGNLWDAALVSANEIIVTLKSKKLLQYIKVESGKLHEGMHINLKRVPWGIAVYKNNILVTFHENPGNGMIEVRDRHGKILRHIVADENGDDLFKSPYYVAVNQHNGDIYVTDGRKNSITCLTFEGKLLYKIESEEFKWPRKVILDDQGNCLLCASLANKILLIKNKSKSPLQSKEEKNDFRVWLKCNRPQTVSIRWEDQTIIVGVHANSMILVLK